MFYDLRKDSTFINSWPLLLSHGHYLHEDVVLLNFIFGKRNIYLDTNGLHRNSGAQTDFSILIGLYELNDT